MAEQTTYDFEVLLEDGATWRGLMLARPRGEDGTPIEGAPVTLSEAIAAYENDLALSKRLTANVQEDWFGGAGIAYNVAPGVYTRTPGYALPAGAATQVLNVSVSGNSSSRIAAMCEFTDTRSRAIWMAQVGDGTINTARILRWTSAGSFSNDYSLGAGTQYFRGLCPFDNGSGTQVLFASSSNSSTLAAGTTGYMHKLQGGAWTQSAVMSGRNSLKKVFWVDQEGIGAWRLVAIDGPGTIAYTVPDADPMDPADWVEGVKISSATGLYTLAAARSHIFAAGGDGLFDIDGLGNAPNLTTYMEQQVHPYQGVAAQYHDGYVYVSTGYGLDRVRVEENGVLQENPGTCSPTWGTRAEHQYGGHVSAMAVDQGWLVAAVYNDATARAAIWYGRDRQIVGVDTPNPLVWHGPEIFGSEDYLVTAMLPSDVGFTAGRKLWIAASPYNVPGPAWLGYVSIPVAGAPIDDLIGGGIHRFATGSGSGTWNATSRLHLLDEGFGDRVSKKILHKHGFETRGPLSSTTKLTFETRADAAPGSTTWTTSDDVTTSPQQEITPATVVSGNRIGRRISFVSPSGTATPPIVGVLDAVRTTAWLVQPDVTVRVLEVEYGDGVANRENGYQESEAVDPDTITQDLIDLTRAAPTTIRDRQGKRYTARFEQVLDREETLAAGTWGKTVRARIELDIVAAL